MHHAAVETALAKLQTKFWVHGASYLGAIKVPPFYYTAGDLFGPFIVTNTSKEQWQSPWCHFQMYGHQNSISRSC